MKVKMLKIFVSEKGPNGGRSDCVYLDLLDGGPKQRIKVEYEVIEVDRKDI